MDEPALAQLQYDLAWTKTVLRIRQKDAVDLEWFMRSSSLPELPQRPGREVQLNGLIGTTVCEGLYVVDALHKGLKAEGAICEFGVAQGATSALLASEIMETRRHFYLFDSFEGLPAPTEEDVLIDDIFKLGSMDAYRGTMASPESEVLARLAEVHFPTERLHVRKGWVADCLAGGDLPEKVAFAYVDFDFFQPIKDALEFLDGRTDPGARVVVDDYGFFSSGAQTATDAFVTGSGGRWLLEMPSAPANHFVTLVRQAV